MSVLQHMFASIPRRWLDSLMRLRLNYPVLDSFLKRIPPLLRGRDAYIQRGVGKGIRFNAGQSAASYILGIHEPETQQLLAQLLHAGMTFYDVGANVGFYSMIAARLVGSGGHVISFEPLPGNAKVFRHNRELNSFSQVTLLEIALSASDRELMFAASERMTDGRLETVQRLPEGYNGAINVTARRLDSLILEGSLPRPDVVKIDVEGAENDVLTGAHETLTRHRPVLLIELHGTNDAIVRTLAALNYCVATQEAYPSVVEAHWNASIVAIPTERTEEISAVLGSRFAMYIPAHATIAA